MTTAAPLSKTLKNQAPAPQAEPVDVALVGLGAIGQAVARAARARSGLRLVAACDVDPAKVGQDVGGLLGEGTWGVAIAPDLGGRKRPDRPLVAIHTTGSFLEDVGEQLLQLVEQGVHVVSSTEELSYPWLKHAAIAAKLDEAARRNGVAVVGVGVNPGFAMDALPAMLSGVALGVEHARVVRVVDTSRRRLNLQKKTGAGMTVDEFNSELAKGRMGHIGLVESAALLALALGWRVDEVTDEISPVVATRPLRSEYLEVETGRVAGLHQIARGLVGSQPVVELDLTMSLGGVEDRDEVHLDGHPKLDLAIPGGLSGDVATTAALLNAVPAIVRAEPGLRTILDLPLPHLRR